MGYVYLWADGIQVNIRLEEHKLCLLVMIGVRPDGRKELIALADGYRESAESWADLRCDCARRGMRAPVLAVGDGALGFWNALREVFPRAGEGRCWFRKKRQRAGRAAEVGAPGDEEGAGGDLGRRGQSPCAGAVKAFAAAYGAKFPKAAAKITDDAEELLAFFDYPRERVGEATPTDPRAQRNRAGRRAAIY